MRSVLFHAGVVDDLEEAKNWYERRRKGLGGEFQTFLEETLDRLAETPLRFAPISLRIAPIRHEVRCARMRRFPYGVYYYVFREETVVVLAVAHHSRDPEHWMKRLLE